MGRKKTETKKSSPFRTGMTVWAMVNDFDDPEDAWREAKILFICDDGDLLVQFTFDENDRRILPEREVQAEMPYAVYQARNKLTEQSLLKKNHILENALKEIYNNGRESTMPTGEWLAGIAKTSLDEASKVK